MRAQAHLHLRLIAAEAIQQHPGRLFAERFQRRMQSCQPVRTRKGLVIKTNQSEILSRHKSKVGGGVQHYQAQRIVRRNNPDRRRTFGSYPAAEQEGAGIRPASIPIGDPGVRSLSLVRHQHYAFRCLTETAQALLDPRGGERRKVDQVAVTAAL